MVQYAYIPGPGPLPGPAQVLGTRALEGSTCAVCVIIEAP